MWSGHSVNFIYPVLHTYLLLVRGLQYTYPVLITAIHTYVYQSMHMQPSVTSTISWSFEP